MAINGHGCNATMRPVKATRNGKPVKDALECGFCASVFVGNKRVKVDVKPCCGLPPVQAA